MGHEEMPSIQAGNTLAWALAAYCELVPLIRDGEGRGAGDGTS